MKNYRNNFNLEIASTVTELKSGEKVFIRLMLEVNDGKHKFVILDVYGDVIFRRASYKIVADKFWGMEIK
jgi:hypothetical protein